MRRFASLVVLAGVGLAILAGCSSDKKTGQPAETAPPPPVLKGKPPPTQAQK